MSSTTLIAESWYLAFHRSWPPSPLDDQYLAGGILWASGDVVALLLLIALFVQWYASSQREARREDRRLDRLEAQSQRASTAPVGSPDQKEEMGYDQPRTGNAAPAEVRTAGTAGSTGDDQ
jgi:Cytochrome c oxidase caa3 assembly factor (Caa3_CtaG)